MARRGDDRSSYERDQDRKLAKERFAAKTAADLAEARYLDQRAAGAQQAGVKQLAGQQQGTGIAASEAGQGMMKDPRFVNSYAKAESDFKSQYGSDPLKYFGTNDQYQSYLNNNALKGLAGDMENERLMQGSRDDVAIADKYNEQFRSAPPQKGSVTRFDSVGGQQIPIKTEYEFGGDLYKAGVQDKENKLRLDQSKVDIDREKIMSDVNMKKLGYDIDREKIAADTDWRKFGATENAKAAAGAAQEKAMVDFADKYMVAYPNANPVEIGQAWNKFMTAGKAQRQPSTAFTVKTQQEREPIVQSQRFQSGPKMQPAHSVQNLAAPVQMPQTGLVQGQPNPAPSFASRIKNFQRPEWLSKPIVPTISDAFRSNIEERKNRAR